MHTNSTRPPCNCTFSPRSLTPECQQALLNLLSRLQTTTIDPRNDPVKQLNADLYSIAILSLFASIIVMLMVRAIKPSESLDDQVTNMLSSMRAKCDLEDDMRHKIKLKQAKDRAQKWLRSATAKSVTQVRKLSSRRPRTSSESGAGLSISDQLSVKSHQIFRSSSALKKPPPYQRAASYHQFVPAIVVTSNPEAVVRAMDDGHHLETALNNDETTNNDESAPLSPRSSTQSLDDTLSQESVSLDPYMEFA